MSYGKVSWSDTRSGCLASVELQRAGDIGLKLGHMWGGCTSSDKKATVALYRNDQLLALDRNLYPSSLRIDAAVGGSYSYAPGYYRACGNISNAAGTITSGACTANIWLR